MTGRFEFATAPRIVFGDGASADLGLLARDLGERVLLCVGGSGSARYGRLLHDVPVVAEYRVPSEPTLEMVRAATDLARTVSVDLVIGLGGGSVLDTAKAVAMLLGNGGDPLDYLETIGAGQPITRPSVPMIAVPTTAGTGAEVTANAVLTSVEHGRKASLRARSMLPSIAVVDPALTSECPPSVTASAGMDALTQCLEPLVSVAATPLSDVLAADGLVRIAGHLRAAFLDGTDRVARSEVALGALLGGMALANAKLGVVHGFAGVIGGLVNAPHGAVCAALLAPAVEVNLAALHERTGNTAALERFDRVARLLTGSPGAVGSDAVPFLRGLTEELGIVGLAGYGVTEMMVDGIVEGTAGAGSTKGNPVVLTAGELRTCLLAAL